MRRYHLIIFIGLVIFLAGCVKEKPKEVQFKNDLITVEDLVVSDISPYEKGDVTIEFDIKNNGDRLVFGAMINLFDIPGFTLTGLDCQLTGKAANLYNSQISPQLKQIPDNIKTKLGRLGLTENQIQSLQGLKLPICIFLDMEPLDSRHMSAKLKALNVDSPTPYKISFSVTYFCPFEELTGTELLERKTCMGSGQAIIPIVDGVIKKEPSFKFSQSDPGFGPIVIDIQPTLERTKVVGDKTIKEYWGTIGQTFTTKFVFKHVGKVEGKIKPPNIEKEKLKLQELFDLTVDVKGCEDFIPQTSTSGTPPLHSQKTINETFNTLVCSFTSISSPGEIEFTATIKIWYEYSYEFIRSVDFVVQPTR